MMLFPANLLASTEKFQRKKSGITGTNSIKALMKTQSSAPNHGKLSNGFILSSSTGGLVMKGALLALRHQFPAAMVL